jgi:Bacterial membrane protein YfhO
MNLNKQSTTPPSSNRYGFLVSLFCLLGILVLLFHQSFEPNMVVHSNDGPLGSIVAKSSSLPGTYSGYWQDLTWVGTAQPSAMPNISVTLNLLLGPYLFAKFYPAIALFVLGLSAWLFFRQTKLAPIACLLGALAAALNSDYFSVACWGVAAQPICFGMNFLALAAVADLSTHRWIKLILAGFAVGMGVMEGFDIGAIFSVFVGVYVLFQAWNTESDTATGKKIMNGVMRAAIVAVFAGIIATQTLTVLINTQIKGIVGVQQDESTKQQKWNEATMWSLPKAEVLQIIVPGIFGYRMDTPDGGTYWGTVGKNPMVDYLEEQAKSGPNEQARAQAAQQLAGAAGNFGLWRFSGGGIYAGVSVVVIALWALFQSFRKTGSPFTLPQRRTIWFWTIAAFIALLLAFGRFAPFYHIFYSIPYASTIRNPAKFIHVFNWALIIIFGYGVHGLFKTYMQNSVPSIFKSKAPSFDKSWLAGCLVALGIGLLAWLVYATSAFKLQTYMQSVGIPPEIAPALASFSIHSVGWFILFFILTIGLLWLIFSGKFSGTNARWGTILLGLVLVFDLSRANQPWIIHWNAAEKYAMDPVLDILQQKSYQQRVTGFFPPGLPPQIQEQQGILKNIYSYNWTQHNFLYYNIQSLDLIQMPRMAEDTAAYREAMLGSQVQTRQWELTNTRYLVAMAGLVDSLNAQFDPVRKSFRLHTAFSLYQNKSGGSILSKIDPNGPFGLIEFTGALPRAQLFSNWQINKSETNTLDVLASSTFDPHKTVLVTNSIPEPNPANTNQSAGTAEIKANYEPKRVELTADVKVPSVLLLNDKFDPDWKVWVDGKPETLLRANFLMRGVYLQPGHHDIVFRYLPPFGVFYVSLAAVVIGILLVGFLAISKPKPEPKSVEAERPKGKAAQL